MEISRDLQAGAVSGRSKVFTWYVEHHFFLEPVEEVKREHKTRGPCLPQHGLGEHSMHSYIL